MTASTKWVTGFLGFALVFWLGAATGADTKKAPTPTPTGTGTLPSPDAGAPAGPAPTDTELHRRAIVVDTHADTTQAFTYFGIDIARPQPDLDLDLPKAAAGGLDAEFFSIFVFPLAVKPAEFHAEALRQIDAVE